jgi:hypothetical protein
VGEHHDADEDAGDQQRPVTSWGGKRSVQQIPPYDL